MKKILLIVLAAILISIGNILAAPMLELSDRLIDFGYTAQDVVLARKFILKSIGDEAVKIDSVVRYCKCIGLPIDNAIIAPGDSLVVNVTINTAAYVGPKEWQPHIYCNTKQKVHRLRLKVNIIQDIEKANFLRVFPKTVVASQFGNKIISDFSFDLINLSDINVPLKLLEADPEYFTLDFPAFIPPHDTIQAIIKLNDKGLNSEFETTIIFEYINDKSEKMTYSMPVRRKLFKVGG